MLHSRSAYKQCTVNGVKVFKQTGMQDAVNSTSSSFLARGRHCASARSSTVPPIQNNQLHRINIVSDRRFDGRRLHLAPLGTQQSDTHLRQLMSNIASADCTLPFVVFLKESMSSPTDKDVERRLQQTPPRTTQDPMCMQLLDYTRKIISCSSTRTAYHFATSTHLCMCSAKLGLCGAAFEISPRFCLRTSQATRTCTCAYECY